MIPELLAYLENLANISTKMTLILFMLYKLKWWHRIILLIVFALVTMITLLIREKRKKLSKCTKQNLIMILIFSMLFIIGYQIIFDHY